MVSVSRKKLEEFKCKNKFLFHGSSDGTIEIFEPRQAFSYGDPDGQPAVYASEEIEPAIFMAVIGSKKIGGWNTDIFSLSRFGFYAPKEDLKKAEQEKWAGFVYVLSKSKFSNKGEWEWISHDGVEPVDMVEVNFADIREEIAIQTFENQEHPR